jgi:hypothetical protein
VRQDYVGSRDLSVSANRIEYGAAAVDDYFQLELVHILADHARAWNRSHFSPNDHGLYEHLEETDQLRPYLDEHFGPELAVSRHRVEKDSVSFYLLKVQRDVDLADDRLDQERNALLTMHRRELVRDHEFRVPADVGEDDDQLLFSAVVLVARPAAASVVTRCKSRRVEGLSPPSVFSCHR